MNINFRSRDAPWHPSFCCTLYESPSNNLPNKREAERRKAHTGAAPYGCGSARIAARAFRRSTADSLRRINASAQLQPRFLGFGVIGCHPHLLLSQSSELLAGRSLLPAGRCPEPPGSGCMARPRAPHSLRIREYPREGVPDERAGGYVTVTGTNVKERLLFRRQNFGSRRREPRLVAFLPQPPGIRPKLTDCAENRPGFHCPVAAVRNNLTATGMVDRIANGTRYRSLGRLQCGVHRAPVCRNSGICWRRIRSPR